MKASKIISQSCCGQGLPIDATKPKLVVMVENIERENERLIVELAELNEAKKNRFTFFVCFWFFFCLLVIT